MDATLLSYLRKTDLLKSIPEPMIAKGFSTGTLGATSYSPKTMIHQEGEKCVYVSLVLEGSLSISRFDPDGNELLITEMGPGNLIAGNLIFSSRPIYPMTVSAKSQVLLLWIKKPLLLQWMQRDEVFLARFLKDMSDNALVIGHKLKAIVQRPLRERVLNYLEREVQKQGNRNLLLPITKTAWANLLGVQRTSLSRVLQQLTQEGLIAMSGRSIQYRGTRPPKTNT